MRTGRPSDFCRRERSSAQQQGRGDRASYYSRHAVSPRFPSRNQTLLMTWGSVARRSTTLLLCDGRREGGIADRGPGPVCPTIRQLGTGRGALPLDRTFATFRRAGGAAIDVRRANNNRQILRKHMRIVHLAGTLILPVGLFCRLDGAAAQGSDAARQACTPDAMRLCSDVIPDVARVTACMKAKSSQLSEACRVAMRGEAFWQAPSRALPPHYHHHHCHHCG